VGYNEWRLDGGGGSGSRSNRGRKGKRKKDREKTQFPYNGPSDVAACVSAYLHPYF
jgi:hypothetical protein